MPTQIQMPKLGLTMTEGTITEWVAAPGQAVSAGDVVMVIETDKVEFEVEAAADGTVAHVADQGATLECGALAGWLLADGEEAPASPNGATPASADAPVAETPAATEAPPSTAPAQSPGGRILSSPNARRVAAELGLDIAGVTGTGPGGRITSEDVQSAAAQRVGVGQPGSPEPARSAVGIAHGADRLVPFAAAKAAERLGVDIDQVAGTGPDGRVSRSDVYEHARSHGAVPARRPVADTAGPSVSPGDIVPVTGMRGVIAERMHSSLQEMAQLTLSMDVDMDRAVALRDQLKEIGADELGSVPGFTDFVIAAVARALRAHPMLNARMEGDRIAVLDEVHVGMAVAVPDGLVVPVVQAADTLPLMDLAVETSRLASAARDKKLTLDEMEGGTFSVSALGMFGVDMFTPVINPPNVGILGVGRIRDDVGWDGDRPHRVKRMTLSLTWDHRVVDGAPAAAFTQTVTQLLEQPLRLL